MLTPLADWRFKREWGTPTWQDGWDIMNECHECEQDEAREVQVRYTTGSAETLELCDSCATQFENGGLVMEVVRTELVH